MSARSADGTVYLTIFSQRAYISCLFLRLGGFLRHLEDAGLEQPPVSSAVMAVTFDVMLLSEDFFLGVHLKTGLCCLS